jgi:hypothetical protein
MRVPDAAARSVVYLGQGTSPETFHAIGTGFLVDDKRVPGGVYYLITADHVAKRLKTPFAIRFNDQENKSHIQQSQLPFQWWRHPTDKSVDAAVFPWGLRGRFATFPINRFISENNLEATRIGIGDEVFIVGLFRKWAGREKFSPVVRHGHIAMMADEPIPTDNYGDTPMHLIEAFSLKGMSGSPVIARQTIPIPLSPRSDDEPDTVLALGAMYLLGLVHGYLPVQEVKQLWHSGISMVVPSTKILEILNQPKLIDYEQQIVTAMKKRKANDDKPVEAALDDELTQLTRPKKGKPIPIPIPVEREVSEFFKKATRKRNKK